MTWLQIRSSPIWRYGVAILSVVVATLIRLWLYPVLGNDFPFITYIVAVVITAWVSGLGPALLATVLGFVIVTYFFIEPRYSFGADGLANLLGLGLYLFVTITSALLNEQLHRARRVAEAQSQALQRSEEWLSTLLNSIGDAVIATDANGLVTFMNPVAETVTGWPQPEALGRPITNVFKIINEQTREPVENPVTRVLREDRVVGLANHTVLIAKSGREIPIDDSGAPIRDGAGTTTGVILVFHDVSEGRQAEQELRKSESRLRDLWENANDIFYTLDLRGNLTSINRAGEEAFGYPREELLNRPINPYIAPEYMAQMQEMVRRKVEGQETTTYELAVVSASGNRVALEVSSRLLYQGGRAVGIQGVARDITERKQAEQERADLLIREQAARAEAEQALRFRDEFLAIASHELKTPLTAIKGYVSLLQRRAARDGSANGNDARALQTIAEQTERLHRLIELLLDLSRIETGQLQIERVPLDLMAAVRRWVESMEPMLNRHTIRLICASDSLPVLGDELRLEQVFQNLVQNATKYSPDGGTVTVRLESDAAQACLSVTDQGIGIPADELTNLFHRFYRAGNVGSLQIGGMGVGLFVVKEIVASHGGTIHVESVEGQGSTFTVLLPLSQNATLEAEKRA
jgi:PAS domain S-box-containing protein